MKSRIIVPIQPRNMLQIDPFADTVSLNGCWGCVDRSQWSLARPQRRDSVCDSTVGSISAKAWLRGQKMENKALDRYKDGRDKNRKMGVVVVVREGKETCRQISVLIDLHP